MKKPQSIYTSLVLGIDPGFSGAFVGTDGKKYLHYFPMPVTGKKSERRIDSEGVYQIVQYFLDEYRAPYIFLERAIPMAMGSKGAFNYGRGFEALIHGIEKAGVAFTLVEPSKWTRVMHEGLSPDLKPKAKSLIAVQKLFPKLLGSLPKNTKGAFHDGPVDALLIAGYGLRQLNRPKDEDVGDFF